MKSIFVAMLCACANSAFAQINPCDLVLAGTPVPNYDLNFKYGRVNYSLTATFLGHDQTLLQVLRHGRAEPSVERSITSLARTHLNVSLMRRDVPEAELDGVAPAAVVDGLGKVRGALALAYRWPLLVRDFSPARSDERDRATIADLRRFLNSRGITNERNFFERALGPIHDALVRALDLKMASYFDYRIFLEPVPPEALAYARQLDDAWAAQGLPTPGGFMAVHRRLRDALVSVAKAYAYDAAATTDTRANAIRRIRRQVRVQSNLREFVNADHSDVPTLWRVIGRDEEYTQLPRDLDRLLDASTPLEEQLTLVRAHATLFPLDETERVALGVPVGVGATTTRSAVEVVASDEHRIYPDGRRLDPPIVELHALDPIP